MRTPVVIRTPCCNRVGPEGTPPLRRCKVARPLTRSGETSRLQTAVAAEFFVDPTGGKRAYLPSLIHRLRIMSCLLSRRGRSFEKQRTSANFKFHRPKPCALCLSLDLSRQSAPLTHFLSCRPSLQPGVPRALEHGFRLRPSRRRTNNHSHK